MLPRCYAGSRVVDVFEGFISPARFTHRVRNKEGTYPTRAPPPRTHFALRRTTSENIRFIAACMQGGRSLPWPSPHPPRQPAIERKRSASTRHACRALHARRVYGLHHLVYRRSTFPGTLEKSPAGFTVPT